MHHTILVNWFNKQFAAYMAALQIKYFLISITCHVSVLLSESFQVGVLYSTSRIVLLFFHVPYNYYMFVQSWFFSLSVLFLVGTLLNIVLREKKVLSYPLYFTSKEPHVLVICSKWSWEIGLLKDFQRFWLVAFLPFSEECLSDKPLNTHLWIIQAWKRLLTRGMNQCCVSMLCL